MPTPVPPDQCNVAISWGGSASLKAAEAFVDLLSKTVQAAECWISPETKKGKDWFSDVLTATSTARVGVVFLTASNVTNPWILFESGILAASGPGEVRFACGYLVGIAPTSAPDPLTRLQLTHATEDDTFRLLRDLRNTLGKRTPSDDVLKSLLTTFWPKFAEVVKSAAVAADAELELGGESRKEPSTREVLDSILDRLSESDRNSPRPRLDDLSRLKYLQQAALFETPEGTASVRMRSAFLRDGLSRLIRILSRAGKINESEVDLLDTLISRLDAVSHGSTTPNQLELNSLLWDAEQTLSRLQSTRAGEMPEGEDEVHGSQRDQRIFRDSEPRQTVRKA